MTRWCDTCNRQHSFPRPTIVPPEQTGAAFVAEVVGFTFVLLALLIGIALLGPVFGAALR